MICADLNQQAFAFYNYMRPRLYHLSYRAVNINLLNVIYGKRVLY